MKQDERSMTALISSFGRAYHFENDDPKIFSDALAGELITDDEYKKIAEYMVRGIDFFAPEKKDELLDQAEILKWIVQTQLAPTPLARARYCKEMLENAIETGIAQYVILGAGMDTSAYKNYDVLSKMSVFEVDHPDTQAFKKQRVEQAGLIAPENLHYVPVDFSEDNLGDELKRSGFIFERRTFFSWLGVSYYMTKEQNLNMFKTISSLVPKGSSIVFDYADENIFTSDLKRVRNMIAMAKASGEPMKSCYNYYELEKALEEAGFLIYEHLFTGEIEKRFFANRTDYLHAFEHINYALAVVE